MSDSYYVRIRGSVHGPYTEETVTKLALAGKVSRVHQISLDGKDWRSAQEFPHLFASRTVENKPSATPGPYPSSAADTKNQWYYTLHGGQKGPVTEPDLRALIVAGAVTSQEQAWTQGQADWQQLDSIAAFRGLFAASSPQSTTTSPAGASRDDPAILPPQICQQLTASLGWLWFIVAVGYLLSFGSLCLAIWLATMSFISRPNLFLLQALYTISFCVVVVTGTALLNGHVARLGRFRREPSLDAYTQAAQWLNAFWCYLAILLIVFLAVAFIFFISTLGIAYPIRTAHFNAAPDLQDSVAQPTARSTTADLRNCNTPGHDTIVSRPTRTRN